MFSFLLNKKYYYRFIKSRFLFTAILLVSFFVCARGFSKENSAILKWQLPPAGFQLADSVSNYNGSQVSCKNASDGTILINVTGGTIPFTYSWSTGASTQNLSNLAAGQYQVFVTDSTGDQDSLVVLLTEPDSLFLNYIHVASTCNLPNGSIEALVSGGVGGNSFLWDDGDTSSLHDSLIAGLYSITVTDQNGCSFSDNQQVTGNGLPIISSDSIIPVSCFGGADGSLYIHSLSGTVPYSYSWSDGSTSEDVINLPAGNYTVVVTDSNSCLDSVIFQVSEPALIEINFAVNNPVCGNSNGTIDANVSGGTFPYQYDWSTGEITQSVSGKTTGSFTVTITDINGCTITGDTDLTSAGIPQIALNTLTHVTCFGNTNGSVDITVSGGTAPYTYSWNNGSLNEDIGGLIYGSYTISVTDQNNCQASSTFLINQPDSVSISLSVIDETCNGANGIINSSVHGGTGLVSYLWSTGDTTTSILNLASGSYTLTVTDSNGCNALGTVILQNLAGPLINVSQVIDVRCHGDSTGLIDISISGGGAPYSYQWNGGLNTEDISGLSAGTYSVTVTDTNNCQAFASVLISEPVALVLFPSYVSGTCGQPNGSASVLVSGGTGPYTYSWSTGQSLSAISGLSASTYTVTVADSLSCSGTAQVTVNDLPGPVISTGFVTDVICNGGNDGAIDISVSSGTPLFSYLWSDGSTSEDLDSLPAGSYTVLVTDANLCSATLVVPVLEPSAISVSFATTNATCGLANGSSVATGSGGSGSLSFSWSNGTTGNTVTNVVAGNYTVTITDGNLCSVIAVSSINNTGGPTVGIGSITNVSCNGSNTGAININVINGITPYQYLWSNGSTTEDISGVPAGNYQVTVTDFNGCIANKNIVIQQSPAIFINLSSQNETCSLANGSITSIAGGGTGSLSYLWSTGNTTSSLSGVAAGIYTLSVTDGNGCTGSAFATLTDLTGPVITAQVVSPISCFGGTDGSIDITVSGGSFPLTFLWSSSDTTEDLTSLSASTYTVIITDVNACSATRLIVISDPPVISANLNTVASTCGLTNGSITCISSGGTGSLDFLWSTGSSLSSISSLTGGTYTVTVSDDNGCTVSFDTILGSFPGPVASIGSVTPVVCNGGLSGSVDLVVTNGTFPFLYAWTNGSSIEDPVNLGASIYTVVVTDQNACTDSVSVTVTEPPSIQMNTSASNANCNLANGTVKVLASGGVGAYTYAWSNGLTVDSISGLTPGIYTITVTDGNGCSLQNTSVVGLTQGLSAAATASGSVSCFGGSDGFIDLTVNGGLPSFGFLWSNGATTEDINGLSTGVYTVTVTDQDNCTTVSGEFIPTSSQITSAFNIQNALSGNPTGSITAIPSGGAGTYSFLWSTASTSNFISGLTAGTYTCTITDQNVCSRLFTPVVGNLTSSCGVNVTLVTDVSCNGGSNGAIDITVTGGIPPFTYLWSNSATTEDLTGLLAGTYTVTVTDSVLCVISTTATVNQPAVLSVAVTGTNGSCGNSNGTATANPSGGNGGYTYLWSTGSTNASITGLGAATYTVTVTDSKGCTANGSKAITVVSAPQITSGVVLNVSCFGGSDGSIDITVANGTTPYTYSWSNGSTTQDVTGLVTASYTITVTDTAGCQVSANYSVSQPNVLAVTLNPVSSTCGNANGIISTNVNGGTGSYSYLWNNGATTTNLSSVSAGTYTITVTDANSCTKTSSASVVNISGPSVVVTSQVQVSCNGGGDGTINITVSSGTVPYTYLWSNTNTTEDISSLAAGTYTVTVSDGNNCTATVSATVTQPTAVNVVVSPSNATCGNSNGSATASASGGTGTFGYLWSTGSTSASVSSLSPGTYTVTVTDAAACTKTGTALISNVAGPTVSVTSQTNVSCNGGGDGSINISVSGGTGSYTYSWSNGTTLEDPIGLAAGTFTVTVSDANSCTATVTALVIEPVIISINVNKTNATCGNSNGSISASPAGGTGTFTYLWSTGNTNSLISNLTPGTYTVTVTDANSCTKTATSVISNIPGPNAVLTLATNVSCHGGNNGAVDITVSSGTSPFTYSWSNASSAEDISSLTSGTYTVTVTDANGCTATLSATITQPSAIVLNTSHVDASCGNANGSATALASGGNGVFNYLWSNGLTTASVSNLAVNIYVVTATDANSCTATAAVNIGNAGAPSISLFTLTPVICNGGSTGGINITVTGGATPYTYSWSNGSTTEDISNAPAGNYTIILTDSNNCATTFDTIITQPSLISVNIVKTDPTCGNANGSMTGSASGGTGGYAFLWSTGSTLATISSLAPGTYTVTITDASACTKTGTASISNVSGPVVTLNTSSNVSCNAGSDGIIDVTVSSGTVPYSYLWSNAETTQDIDSLTSGTYTVTVTDANACTATLSVVLSQPSPITINTTFSNATCLQANGSVTANPSGGTGSFTFLWSTGKTTATSAGVSAGTYTITVSDANGCTKTATRLVSDNGLPLVSLTTLTPVACNGNSTGGINISVSSGTTPYTYTWSNSITTQDLAGVIAGSYTVTVTDASGCTAVFDTLVTEPSVIVISLNKSNASCGNSNGSIQAIPSGGSGGFTYLWSNAVTTSTASNLSAGTYTVTVTDANSCTRTGTTSISTISGPAISLTVSDSVSCNGGNDGLIDITVSGGTNPYTYLWTTGDTTEDLDSLVAGTYTVTVTDSIGCADTLSILVSQPAAIFIASSTINATCGLANGSATASPSGGTGAYTYLWSSGSTTSTATGLISGNYTVTVTDFNSCTQTKLISVNNTGGPSVVLNTLTNLLCHGASNGSITLTVSGGNTPYTYSWSNGKTTKNNFSLSAGTYTLTVTDSLGCLTLFDTTVTEPAALAVSFSNNNASCGGNNGVSTAVVSGGTPGYTLLWSNGKTTATLTGLGSGNYTVTVTDLNGCTKKFTTSISNTSNPSILPVVISNVSCFGGADGQIDISVSNGSPPYTYQWSNGITNEDLTGLTANTYTVTVTDSVGCVAVFSTAVSQPSKINLTMSSIPAACNQSNGTATVVATGGTGILTYLWSNGVTTSTNAGISGGTYTVTATDANACTRSAAVTVANTNAPVITLVLNNPVNCNGGTSGDINISVSSGGSPYTYSWSNGKTTQDNLNVASGTYTVTVTGQTGCTATSSYFVDQPSVIVISETITNTNCGISNGSISLSVSGGIVPYTYSWSTGSTTDTITGLPSGNYTIVVTDSNGCSKSKIIAVNDLGGPLVTLNALSDVTCYGGNNGAIAVSVTGGIPSYQYLWSNGGTTASINGLFIGTYTLTVTDSANCITNKQYIINEPSLIQFSVSGTNPTCGKNNGFLVVNSTSGGTGPYQFLWSNGNTTTGLNNLFPGSYTLTITDFNNCTADTSVTLSDPGNPVISLDSVVAVQCNAGSNGKIYISVTGGYANYIYVWSNGSTLQDLLNVTASSYTIIVSDSVGCGDTATYSITQPSALQLSVNATDATCGVINGSVNSSVSGGSPSYQYAWSNGSTTSSISSLSPAVYTLTVTDSHGCTSIAVDTVNNASGPSVQLVSITDVSCFGQSNGAVNITVTGGTVPYTYSWSNNSTGQDISSVSSNTYTVTVTDAFGCTATLSANVTEPALLTVQMNTMSAVCGMANGSASANVTGGNGGNGYLWNTGSTLSSINGLAIGTYTVTVTDSKGCTATKTGIVTGTISPVVALQALNNVSCNGFGDGSVNITISGGQIPYTYSWSNGATNQDISMTGPGNYTVTVTDANGCTGTLSAQITEPAPLIVNVFTTNSACNFATGAIKVVPFGGTMPYTYLWFSGSVSDSIGGLAAGNYTVSVTDANGCFLDSTITVNNPGAPLVTINNIKDVTCYGGNDGIIEIDVSGGNGPYSYIWTNGETTEDIQNLSANTFTVTVTDQFGCSSVFTQVIKEPTDIVINIATVSATCGSANGSACIAISGGISPYVFIWSNGFTTTCIQNLTAGSYQVTVTDMNGCIKIDAANVSNLTGPNILVADSANIKCFNGSDGSININVSGGSSPYTFAWSNGITTEDLTNLTAGTYTVTITDNIGCLAIQSITLSEPSAISRFAVSPFLNDTFNISCFGASDGSIDLTVTDGTPPYTYSWSDFSTTEDISNLSVGFYTVIITDSHGCTVSSTYQVTQPPELKSNAGSNFTICGIDSTSLYADSLLPGLTGFWQVVLGSGVFADSTQPTSVISQLTNGNSLLQWIVTDGICYDTSVITLSVSTEIKAIAGIDIVTCEDTVFLTATPTFFGYGFWTPILGTGIIKDTLDPTTKIKELSVGTNSFQWIVVNGNCTDTDYVNVQRLEPNSCLSNIEMPSGFSPNEDGKNDFFVIRGLEDYPFNNLTIFNRWGNLVYEKKGYTNNWKGISNDNKILPEGTYFVILKIDNYPILIKGFVDLRR